MAYVTLYAIYGQYIKIYFIFKILFIFYFKRKWPIIVIIITATIMVN